MRKPMNLKSCLWRPLQRPLITWRLCSRRSLYRYQVWKKRIRRTLQIAVSISISPLLLVFKTYSTRVMLFCSWCLQTYRERSTGGGKLSVLNNLRTGFPTLYLLLCWYVEYIYKYIFYMLSFPFCSSYIHIITLHPPSSFAFCLFSHFCWHHYHPTVLSFVSMY